MVEREVNMSIKVNGIMRTKVEVNPKEFLQALKEETFPRESFVKDGKVYKWVDVGTHTSDYEKYLVSDEPDKVAMLSAIDTLLELMK